MGIAVAPGDATSGPGFSGSVIGGTTPTITVGGNPVVTTNDQQSSTNQATGVTSVLKLLQGTTNITANGAPIVTNQFPAADGTTIIATGPPQIQIG